MSLEPHGIGEAFDDVRQFHKVFGHPVADKPRLQPQKRVESRANWMRSEIDELEAAEDVVEQADAYLDIIYFALGGLVDVGVRPEPIWEMVHAANMAKLQPDGTVKRYPDGKIMKPDGWTAPDEKIRAYIERMIRDNQPGFL